MDVFVANDCGEMAFHACSDSIFPLPKNKNGGFWTLTIEIASRQQNA